MNVNPDQRLDFISVDNFYADPVGVRRLALGLPFYEDRNYYQGRRSQTYAFDDVKQRFEELMGKKITKWDYPVNGAFQYTTADDKLVYHMDSQQWAAIIYLTPSAPAECGTSFYKTMGYRMDPRLEDKDRDEAFYERAINQIFKGGFFDSTKFVEVDRIGNVFNRCVIWNAKLLHAASRYFGKELIDGRLFQIFFFDAE